MATTTMSAIVMVRFRRSPIQISCKTKCERMLADPLVVGRVGAALRLGGGSPARR